MASGTVPILAASSESNMYDVKKYRLVLTFGSSVLTSYYGKPAAAARTGAGAYTITLPKSYVLLVGASYAFQDASGAILFMVVVSTTNLSVDGTITIETRTEAGTATDPTSGDKLLVTLEVSDSPLNTSVTI